MHEFQQLRINANSETPLLVQLAAEMSLPRIACVALLQSTMLPLAQSRCCMNRTTANRRTSNRKPPRQCNSAAEMILPCLAQPACMKFSAPRADGALV